jgi:Ni/Fe-hydrogenase subunit HybB-like protein
MTRFFHDLAGFFVGLYRGIIWFVVLVAYCAVRGMDKAYDYVNRHWFDGDDSVKLAIAAAVLMGIGVIIQVFKRFRRKRRDEQPERRWPLVGPASVKSCMKDSG